MKGEKESGARHTSVHLSVSSLLLLEYVGFESEKFFRLFGAGLQFFFLFFFSNIIRYNPPVELRTVLISDKLFGASDPEHFDSGRVSCECEIRRFERPYVTDF